MITGTDYLMVEKADGNAHADAGRTQYPRR